MSDINDAQIEAANRLLHHIMFALRFDRLEQLSSKLAGLQPVELHILQLVSDRPDLILKEIREILNMPNSTLTSILDRLEQRGLLRRQISPRDRRSFRLELTQKGQAIQAEHDRVDRLVAARVLSAFEDNAEREQALRLLAKLVEKLD